MYKRIVVPVDGSPTSVRGLDEAIELARLSGATIRLVHVLDQVVYLGGDNYGVDVFGSRRREGERIMQEMKARVVMAGVDVSTFVSEILPGRVCDVVMEQVKDFDAHLIVVGTHGRRGVGRFLVGSDAEQIVRIATVPVLLVRAPQGAASAADSSATAGAASTDAAA